MTGDVLDGSRRSTAADLARTRAAIGAAFEHRPAWYRTGTGPSDDPPAVRVAITCGDRATFAAAVGAALDSDRVAIPLGEQPPAPDSLQADTVATRLADCRPHCIVADSGWVELLAGHGYGPGRAIDDDHVLLWRRPDGPTTPEPTTGQPGAVALIVYTSGSSGAPKGVLISPAVLRFVAETNRRLYRWGSGDRLLSMLPMTHLAGLTNVIGALDVGADVVISPSMAFAGQVGAVVAETAVTIVGVVPHQLARFAAIEPDRLRTVRSVVCSGAPLTGPVATTVAEAFPGAEAWNAYGLTEAFRSFVAPVGSTSGETTAATDIGRPVAGVEARLWNAEDDRPAEDGADGEIQLRGRNLYSGYLNQRSTGNGDGGWLATGDLARIDRDGRYTLVGRRSSFVNVGGEKAAVESIEAVIDPVAPGRIAVTTTVDGNGFEQIVVVAERSAGADLIDVKRACSRRLASSLRPRELLEVDRLPRTAMGKIDRPALAAMTTNNSHSTEIRTNDKNKDSIR